MATNINPAASASADPGASPASAGNQNGGVNPPSPGDGSGGASPAPAAESAGIKQLREAYENLKKEYEPYQKLGKLEDIQGRIGTYQKLETNALEMGAELGYSEEEIREAMQDDPAGTIALLRRKQAESAQNQNPELVQLRKEIGELKKSLDPLKQSNEQQKMEQARLRFDGAFDAAIKQIYKDENLSSEEMDQLWEDALQLMKADKDAMNRFVNEGKTADVLRFVTAARERADKIYLARVNREKKPGEGDGGKPPELTDEKLSIDDIIAGKAPKGHALSKYFGS